MNQLRPRLTQEELRFLAQVLRHYESFTRSKQLEIEKKKREIEKLNRQIRLEGYPALLKRRVAEKELADMRRQHYFEKGLVAGILANHFERLAKGGKPRYGVFARFELEKLRGTT